MYDAISKASGANARRRENGGTAMQFSPSYGVRMGFIKDPNWPPAHIPDEGTAAQRRHLRIKCGFMVRLTGGHLAPACGDLSAGGAKFTLDAAIGSELEI